jgi:hypothetical protein
MVNENHFWFDRKSFFNFWKLIYGFKNRKLFSEIILFVIARSFDIWLLKSDNSRSSEIRRHGNPASSRHRNNAGCRMPVDQILAEYGRNPAMVRNRSDPAKMVRIRLDLIGSGHWSDWIWPNWQGSNRLFRISVTTTFSLFVIFSCVPNIKIFF